MRTVSRNLVLDHRGIIDTVVKILDIDEDDYESLLCSIKKIDGLSVRNIYYLKFL